jgi:hypothetical protein
MVFLVERAILRRGLGVNEDGRVADEVYVKVEQTPGQAFVQH